MTATTLLTVLRRHIDAPWASQPGVLASKLKVYGVFALLIALGFLSLALAWDSLVSATIFFLAMLYGVGACVYLMSQYARTEGAPGFFDGGMHPKHGLLSGAPRSRLSLVFWGGVSIASMAGAVWLVLVETGPTPSADPNDQAYFYIMGTLVLALNAYAIPVYGSASYVVRRWGTTTPPDHVVWGFLAGSGLVSLATTWAAIQWALLQGSPEATGWFADWVGWVPAVLVAGNSAFTAVRRLMVSTWEARLAEQRLRAEAAEQARALAEAQLAVMQAQIEPHFLYNTLASVQYLVSKDAKAADFLLTQLVRYLRHAMPRMRQPMSTLAQEFELVDAFLQIARMRMGGRLGVQVELGERLHGIEFPPLVIQTLVENAIKHGVEPKLGPVRICVSAKLTEGELCIEVADNGVGLGRAATAGSGMGLANIRERLASIYGDEAVLSLAGALDGGVTSTVRLRMPVPEPVLAAPTPGVHSSQPTSTS